MRSLNTLRTTSMEILNLGDEVPIHSMASVYIIDNQPEIHCAYIGTHYMGPQLSQLSRGCSDYTDLKKRQVNNIHDIFMRSYHWKCIASLMYTDVSVIWTSAGPIGSV